MSDKKVRKGKKKIVWTEDVDSGVLTAKAPNGATAQFSTALLPEDIVLRLLAYGLKQKLSDSVSNEKDPQRKLQGMRETYELLCQGIWERERQGTSALREQLEKQKEIMRKAQELIAEGKIQEAQELLSQL